MSPHPSTNFEIQNYYQNEPKFNGFYSRGTDLPKKGMGIRKTTWWVQINRNALDTFVCDWW